MKKADKELVQDFLSSIRSSVGTRGDETNEDILIDEREVEGFNFLAGVFEISPIEVRGYDQETIAVEIYLRHNKRRAKIDRREDSWKEAEKERTQPIKETRMFYTFTFSDNSVLRFAKNGLEVYT